VGSSGLRKQIGHEKNPKGIFIALMAGGKEIGIEEVEEFPLEGKFTEWT